MLYMVLYMVTENPVSDAVCDLEYICIRLLVTVSWSEVGCEAGWSDQWRCYHVQSMFALTCGKHRLHYGCHPTLVPKYREWAPSGVCLKVQRVGAFRYLP